LCRHPNALIGVTRRDAIAYQKDAMALSKMFRA
jgi:hypothetical protein